MKRAPLERSTPIRRKAVAKRRRPAVRCSWSDRCKKRPDVVISETERYCHGHATMTADALVGTFVKERDGWRCQLRSFNGRPCSSEQVYWCHLIPKGRYHATRWIPLNAVAGCAGHHKAFDEAPLEKDDWCEQRLGVAQWHDLKVQARRVKSVDVVEVIAFYRTVAAA